MVNVGYHIARTKGALKRSAYRAALGWFQPPLPTHETEFPFAVYAYSGEAALPEQVASIRSFVRHVGAPKKFTVVSDGTYSQRSISLLQQLHPAVSVEPASEWMPSDVDGRLIAYLRNHPTGKQLALIMSLPREGPAFYVDSDVLFFKGATRLSSCLSTHPDAPALYQSDCQTSADERLFRVEAERTSPVNTGVLFLRRKLDWSLGVARFSELEAPPNFFTNQTMTHLTMHANGAQPLDPAQFVLQLDDQFVYGDRYAGRDIVLRHYVNPVRHKLWVSL